MRRRCTLASYEHVAPNARSLAHSRLSGTQAHSGVHNDAHLGGEHQGFEVRLATGQFGEARLDRQHGLLQPLLGLALDAKDLAYRVRVCACACMSPV